MISEILLMVDPGVTRGLDTPLEIELGIAESVRAR